MVCCLFIQNIVWYFLKLHENIENNYKESLGVLVEVSEEVHWIIGPPPPVKPGIVLENGMTA